MRLPPSSTALQALCAVAAAAAAPGDRVAAATPAPPAALDPQSGKLLFVDKDVLAESDDDITLEVHPPQKLGPVITSTEPWEAAAVYAYNTMLKVNDTTFFMYYDVVASNTPLLRFTALAISNDGVTFQKPKLEAAIFNGSSANNIVWPRSDGRNGHPAYDYHEPGTVFIDSKPGVPASERFKMVCSWKGGVWLLSSPDGISFAPMFGKPVVPGSDTQNVAFYDHRTKRYVGYIRIDNPDPKEHPSNESCPIQAPIRRIGRCDLGTNLTPPWPCTLKDAQDVFTFDEQDPVCMDIYTNAATPYYGVYLFFPSVFMHMEFATGTGNDGILEGRLAVSRDGHTAKYVDAPNARGPFLPLGVNRCDELQPAKYPAGVEWCANDATMGKSDFDASEIYTAAGYALGSDGESVIVYYGGMAYTHGESGQPQPGRHNSGVGAARLRLDGFVSINAPRQFNVPNMPHSLPSFTTVSLSVPSAANCHVPTNRTVPSHPPSTCCSFEVPGRDCSNKPGYSTVTCQAASDCAKKVQQPLSGCTCGGKPVQCISGICTNRDEHGGGDLCATGQNSSKTPRIALDGGLVLELNVQTSVAGLVYVELQDGKTGAPLPGHALGDARGVRGNFFHKVVGWSAGTSLSKYAGQTVRLKFAMTDAKLYSASFQCAS